MISQLAQRLHIGVIAFGWAILVAGAAGFQFGSLGQPAAAPAGSPAKSLGPSSASNTNAVAATPEARADVVREALRHLWQGYRAQAWGADEVRPISGGPGGHWGNVGMAILDTMDTLWLAGMRKEFDEGERWIAGLRLNASQPDVEAGERASFFETTIRGLGGLLSSYALSGRPVLLEKARELGDGLVRAFPQPDSRGSHERLWPAAYINVREPWDVEETPGWLGVNILADAGTNILEFVYLSEASGDPRYKAAAQENEARLINLASRSGRHLAPEFLAPSERAFATDKATVGAFGDSYFEYLLKAYLQSGRKEHRLLLEWKAAMQEMRAALVRTSPGGLTYLARSAGETEMEELSCFVGGLLALGSHFVPQDEVEDWWLPVGAEVTRTCFEMYRRSPSGLAPERVTLERGRELQATDAYYRGRPETLESLFYLHRITGNHTYRDWSWEIFDAINKRTRTRWGFASARSVSRLPLELDDSEETFLGAETLKYALLAQMPPSALPLERFVLNTEAHPLPVVPASGGGPLDG